MATVAELDVKIDAHDDATRQILELDALIKSLDGGDVNVNVDADTGKADADIAHLIAEINAIGDETINIDLDEGAATAKILALEAELKAIPDEKVKIDTKIDDKGLRRARVDMNKLEGGALTASRQVSLLATAILGLGSALVPLGAVAAGGIAALSGLFAVAGAGAALFGLVAKTAFGNVTNALKKMTTLQQQYNTAVTDKQREAAQQKMKALLDSLSPAEAKMVQGVQDFKNAWHAFAQQFQPQIFAIATEGLKGITAMLPSLAPIVHGAADAFQSLTHSAVTALAGPFWQNFISIMGQVTGPLMTSLGHSIGNVIKAFAALTLAFMPLTIDFTGGLEKMTGALATWATNLSKTKGFRDFVSYVRENTPLVLSLFAAFGRAFVAIVKAAAPMGEKLIIMTTNLLNAVAAFQQANPLAFSFALALIGILTVTLNLAGPLLAMAKFLGLLAGAFGALLDVVPLVAGALGIAIAPFVAIIAVVAAMVGALVFAYIHFKTFRDGVNAVATALGGWAASVWTSVVGGLKAVAGWLSATFGPAVQAVMDFTVQQFQKIVDWITSNKDVWAADWQTIKAAVTDFWNLVGPLVIQWLNAWKDIFTTVWPVIVSIVQGAWIAIKGIISGALDIIMGIILIFGGILQGDWGTIWNGIVQVFRGIWEIIKGIAVGAFVALNAIIWAGLNAIAAPFKAIGLTLVAGWLNAWDTIRSISSAAWAFLVAGTRAFQAGVQTIITAMWAGIIAAFRGGISLMVSGLLNAWGTIRSATSSTWNFITGLIRSGVSNSASAVSSGFSRMAASSVNGMESMGRAISSGWNSIVGSIGSGIGRSVSAIQGATGRFFAAGAALMRSLASGILSGISSAVSAVSGAVSRLTDLLPGSPAKVGPLSGQGYALIRGQHLSEDLAAGIAGRAGLVSSAIHDIADLMSLNLDPAGAFVSMAGSATTGSYGGPQATITIEAGAIQVGVGDGVTPAQAKEAFSTASNDLADKLKTALRRQ